MTELKIFKSIAFGENMPNINNIQLFKGECLELMKTITDKSIDMILCDLPTKDRII